MFKNKNVWLNYFRPNAYVKNIKAINATTLKRNGIRLIICDLDNTLAPHFSRIPNSEAIKFRNQFIDEGIIFVVVSNNIKKRVEKFCNILKPDLYLSNAKKPLVGKIKKILAKYDVEPKETIMVGDQFIIDIFAANRIKCKSILVLPLISPNADESTGFLSRFLEKFVYKKLSQNNMFNFSEFYNDIIEKSNEIL